MFYCEPQPTQTYAIRRGNSKLFLVFILFVVNRSERSGFPTDKSRHLCYIHGLAEGDKYQQYCDCARLAEVQRWTNL